MLGKDASNFMFHASQASPSTRHIERLVARSKLRTFPFLTSSCFAFYLVLRMNCTGPEESYTIAREMKSSKSRRGYNNHLNAICN